MVNVRKARSTPARALKEETIGWPSPLPWGGVGSGRDYVRNRTTSPFAALDMATGTVISSVHRRHRHQEFLKFLKKIDDELPAGLEVHLICDNYGTHKTRSRAGSVRTARGRAGPCLGVHLGVY